MENNFDLRKFLVENKLTNNSRLLAEAVEVPEWLKGKLADVHSKPGQGSIFAKPIDTVMKTVQQIVDGAKNIDQVANSTGTLTVSSPGIGYNLVLPMAQALKLPGAKQGQVEKVEGPNKIKVPSVTTTAPLSQFTSNELTVIVRPKKDEAGAVIPNEYIVLSAFPGDPDIPRASEWGSKFAVIIPGGEQEVNEQNALIDEGLLSWIKDKAVGFAKQINKLTGNSLTSLFTKILPADLVNFVKAQAAAYKPGPSVVKEYRAMNYRNLLERRKKDDDKIQYGIKYKDTSPEYMKQNVKSDQETDKMNDQEYQAYLQQMADNVIFPIDFEGEMRDKSNFDLYRFFKSRGIAVTTELVTDAKPTLQTIERKIGTMPGLSRTMKKLYIYGTYVLFFGMVVAKIGTMLLEEESTETL